MAEKKNLFENVEIIDEEEYSSGIPSIKQIVLIHIRKISEICCKELTPGYWQERPVKVDAGIMLLKEYHASLKEAYCNAVDYLVDLVYPDMPDPEKQKGIEIKKMVDDDEKISYGFKEEDMDNKLKSRKKMFRHLNIFFKEMGYFEDNSVRSQKTG